MITLFLISGCLIDRELYERRRAELLAEAEEGADTRDDTGCAPEPVWVDADGDGWGNSAYPDERCGDLSGWATVDGDCDDGNGAINPEAEELCATDADDDCDGEVNEAGAVDGVSRYGDADGDGYGDPATTGTVCGTAAGWVADATDCDDADDTVNPGADEVCNTGVDEDCDAETTCRLEGEVSVGDADVTLYGEVGVGIPSPVGDQTGDGTDDFMLVTGHTTAILVSNPENGVFNVVDRGPVLTNDTFPDLNLFHAAGGDFDGDGARDLAAAVMHPDVIGDSAVFVLDGPFDASRSTEDARSLLVGDGTRVLGFSLASAADINEDGLDELLVSEISLDGASSVYLQQPTASLTTTTDALTIFSGNGAFGYAVAAGDANDDGLSDVVVAAPGGSEERGVIYIYLGPIGEGYVFEEDASITGASAGDIMGVSLVFQPFVDADGDGDDDLLVGAWGVSEVAPNAGAAYLFAGPLGSHLEVTDAVGTYAGSHADAGLGYAVNGAADVDGDGRGDLLIGANPSSSDDTTGRTYLLYGPGTGSYLESDLDVEFRPEAGGDANRLGYSPIIPGDMDGDGFDEVLLVDPFATGGAGAAYLYRGTGP